MSELKFNKQDKSDSLREFSDDEIRDLKAQGLIIYRMRKSKDGKHCVAKDGTVYFIKNGNYTRLGHLNNEGNLVPCDPKGLSKKARRKLRKEAQNAKDNR